MWSEREVGRESARLHGLAARGLDDAGLLDFRHEVDCKRNAINDSTTPNRPGVFDGKLDEPLRAAGLSVPNDHVVRGALRPLFRKSWDAVLATSEGLPSALGHPTANIPSPAPLASARLHKSPAAPPSPAESGAAHIGQSLDSR